MKVREFAGSHCFVNHFRGHEIETARAKLELLVVARERRCAIDHRVRLIGGVPMLAHVNRFGCVDEQIGGMRFGSTCRKHMTAPARNT
jgi:hypothetical protein